MKLHLLQKRAVRYIANVPRLFYTTNLFSKFEILPAFFLYNYPLLLSYRSYLKPNKFIVFFMANLKANRSIRDTRHKEEWHVRTPRTNYDKQSLTHTVPILLNQLAQEDFDPLCNSNNEIRLFSQLCQID